MRHNALVHAYSIKESESVFSSHKPDQVLFATIFARQNDNLGPTILPMIQPLQFFALECKARCSLLVLFLLTAVGFGNDNRVE